MKIEGSIEEIKQFIKEFQSKDTAFTKQQLRQIEELIKEKSITVTNNAEKVSEAILDKIEKYNKEKQSQT